MAERDLHRSDKWLANHIGHDRYLLRRLAGMVERDEREMARAALPADSPQERPFLGSQYRGRWKTIRRKARYITSPRPELMQVQKAIRSRLLLPVPVSSIVFSDTKGRCARRNAAQHLRTPDLAAIDIRDCYPSMTNSMVFEMFINTFPIDASLAGLLTRLTTLCGHLPQGAPTSGALANLILAPLDVMLEDLAAHLGLVVTRYVDNIDFSGRRSREAILPTIAKLQEMGFAVRRSKVQHSGYSKPKIVTGQDVSGRELRLPRVKRGNVRAAVHEAIWRHEHGLPLADKALASLRGRIQHLRMNGHAGEADRFTARLAAARVI